jgi:predicted Na+-dependent transporter
MLAFRKSIFEASTAPLRWLGRQGTRALTATVVIGIAAPPIGAFLKPFVTEAVFVLLFVAFLRMNVAAVRSYLRRPGILATMIAWTTLVIPGLFGGIGLLVGVDARSPDLFLALMLQGVAPPMMAVPALAALMGLDPTIALVGLIASSIVTPFTAPLLAYAFVGNGMTLSPLQFGLKLFAILGGAGILAFLCRRIIGTEIINHSKLTIDGFNILILFIFVTAVMANVPTQFMAAPLATILMAILAFLVFLALFLLTISFFIAVGQNRADAVSLGLLTSQRNMGLMLAATNGVLPDLTWLYFALCQFPIYLSPQLIKWAMSLRSKSLEIRVTLPRGS